MHIVKFEVALLPLPGTAAGLPARQRCTEKKEAWSYRGLLESKGCCSSQLTVDAHADTDGGGHTVDRVAVVGSTASDDAGDWRELVCALRVLANPPFLGLRYGVPGDLMPDAAWAAALTELVLGTEGVDDEVRAALL